MKVMQFSRYGAPDVLELADAPLPEPGDAMVRVRIRATAVNPADPKWRQGMFESFAPIPFPHVPGYDIAGIVDALGAGVEGFAPGDRVFGMLDAMTKGGYAEYACLPAADLVPIPTAMDFATAAALPTAGLTGVQMAEEHAKSGPDLRILITGATGAVGRFATFAALAAGATVIAAVRALQVAEAKTLGAQETLILGEDDATPAPFDQVIDTVGGPEASRLARHVKLIGGIFTAATTPLDKAILPIDPEFVMVHKDTARLAALAQSVADGGLSVPIARRLPLDQAAEAHRLVEAGGTGGKIILEP